jgi:hypothetical protein
LELREGIYGQNFYLFHPHREDKPKAVNVSNLICDVFGEVKPETLNVGQVALTEVLEEDSLPF